MRVLFVMRHAGFARNFESTLELLAERGHEVRVAFDGPLPDALAARPGGVVERLAARFPSVSLDPAPDRSTEGFAALGRRLRAGVDYLRYLEPRYAGAAKLRDRAAGHAGLLLRLLARLAGRRPGGPAALSRALRRLDAALPPSRRALRFVRDARPDVLLVTPLVEHGAPQTDFVRAARALGVPTGLCVASWDNLTNKGVIAEPPDLVTVWNEAQAREAVELHGVPPDRVVATGAQTYDHWFEWAPARGRDEFATRVGLPEERPYVLYVCSSMFIAPEEVGFVRRWIEGLRARPEPALRGAGVLVRPHPQNARQWDGVDLDGLGAVAVWPRGGADPVDVESRRDYFDSLFHSAAVVGVNTSALIESAIVGRPVLTWLAPEFRDTQSGVPHFAHLADGGPLTVAGSFEQHAAQLAAVLDGGAGPSEAANGFLRSFVRPHGLEHAATPRLVTAIEGLAELPPLPVAAGPRRASRALLAPLAAGAALDAHARRGVRRALAVPAVGRLAARVAPAAVKPPP